MSIDTWGAELKLRAKTARVGMKTTPTGLIRLKFAAKCIGCYTLFVFYRAYRGFFVIVPAVFREVQEKLQAGFTEAETAVNADVDPGTGKLRTRR